jgi:predicted DNA-binding protein (UPF0251 family)
MHFVDGMTQVEIAATLGITRRTVFNRLKQLEKLARALMNEGEATAGGGEEAGDS